LSLTLINPEIVSHYGKKIAEWEGCISGPDMYGKAMRYPKVRLRWLDGHAHPHQKTFEGLVAQVIQHEVDHLNGILFVDRVKDPKTYMTFSEYKKLRAIERTAAKQNLKSPKAPISRLTASKALNS
jgi:peptide deformylase